MKPAAIYARVSSDRQKEDQTIGSQIMALKEYSQLNGYTVPSEWIFQDEGYSGSILVRPALERLRDLVAEGQIETILIYSPDRLSRKYVRMKVRAFLDKKKAVYYTNYRYPNNLIKRWGLVYLMDFYSGNTYSLLRGQ